ncbi:hypothetical protein [Desulfotomaculum sp. 1211_IL3151]|uniref:hypothetical protein n=1 Tax=Desulfotomaculum sp. 1211_IL3151 TaxID=3084055 RepID=UPI002FD8C78E
MALKKEIKAYIKAELRDYPQTKMELIELKEDIAEGAPTMVDDVGGNTSAFTHRIGRPAEAKAIAILTNKRIKRMEQVIKAINIVIGELPEEKVKLVVLKYWQRPRRLTDAGIALEIGCDRATLYRWINGILLAIAIELGLANETCDKYATFGS